MMWRIRRLLCRLYHSVRPDAAEPDLRREIASHLHRLEETLGAAGATPDDAQRRARRLFGGIEKAKEQHRDARSFRGISAIRRLAAMATPVRCWAQPRLAAGPGAGRRTVAISGGGRDFFSVQQLPVLAGREFDDSPHDAQSSVIVNTTFARLYWPGRTSLPLGETLVVPLGSQQPTRAVIGIVRDEHCDNLLSANERPCAYLPVSLTESLGMLRIRTRAAPLTYAETLRRRVRRLHPDAAVSENIALDALLDALTAQHRAAMLASAGLAVFAVVLVTAGLIAVFTAMVRLRERDLALRLALGAAPSMLQRHMLWRGVSIAGVGVAIGVAVAWWAGRIVAPQLYDVDVHVPWLLVVPLGLGMVAVLAVARATRLVWRIDPALPLKSASVG